MVHPGVFLLLLLAMAMVSEKHERILKFVPGRLEGQQSRLTVRRSPLWLRTKRPRLSPIPRANVACKSRGQGRTLLYSASAMTCGGMTTATGCFSTRAERCDSRR